MSEDVKLDANQQAFVLQCERIAEQRGRAAGLAEAVKVADEMAAQIERDLKLVADGKDVLETYQLALFHIADRLRALSTSPGEHVECVAWRTEIDDESHMWIASTIAHDIMAQGDTFEEAKMRLETAIALDKQGLKTGPSPVCKSFRAMLSAEE